MCTISGGMSAEKKDLLYRSLLYELLIFLKLNGTIIIEKAEDPAKSGS